jgi:hypothetical protein
VLVTATDETYCSLRQLNGSGSGVWTQHSWVLPSPWYLAWLLKWKFDGLLGQRMLVCVENGSVQSCALLNHETVTCTDVELAEYTHVHHQSMVRRLLSSARVPPSGAMASRPR